MTRGVVAGSFVREFRDAEGRETHDYAFSFLRVQPPSPCSLSHFERVTVSPPFESSRSTDSRFFFSTAEKARSLSHTLDPFAGSATRRCRSRCASRSSPTAPKTGPKSPSQREDETHLFSKKKRAVRIPARRRSLRTALASRARKRHVSRRDRGERTRTASRVSREGKTRGLRARDRRATRRRE